MFAGLEIIGSDAFFQTGLQSVSVQTQVASTTKLFIHNADAVFTTDLVPMVETKIKSVGYGEI